MIVFLGNFIVHLFCMLFSKKISRYNNKNISIVNESIIKFFMDSLENRFIKFLCTITVCIILVVKQYYYNDLVTTEILFLQISKPKHIF